MGVRDIKHSFSIGQGSNFLKYIQNHYLKSKVFLIYFHNRVFKISGCNKLGLKKYILNFITNIYVQISKAQ